jgi:Protein of unknown function (DUF3040)
MNEDQVTQAIDEIKRTLAHDDPAFVQRVRQLRRRDGVTDLSVFVLLAVGAVLLTVGLATLSWPTVVAGLLALVASVLVDEHHKRSLKRVP